MSFKIEGKLVMGKNYCPTVNAQLDTVNEMIVSFATRDTTNTISDSNCILCLTDITQII